MERPVQAKINTQIYEEACEWFIECRSGDLDAPARSEFDRWLRKSPEHQSAYLEIAAIWNEGPTLDPANKWDLDTLVAQAAEDPGNVLALARTARANGHTPQPITKDDGNVIPVAREGRGSEEPQQREGEGRDSPGMPRQVPSELSPPSAHGRRGAGLGSGRVRVFAIAASILLVSVALVMYFLTPSGVYTTALGEQRSLALADGSTVQLNSLSQVRIRYTEHQRTVYLVEGQALFQVAKDTARPFVVYSDQTRVRAVGTQFDVYRKSDGTIVTVVEGRVAVIPTYVSEQEKPAPGTNLGSSGLHPQGQGGKGSAQWQGEGEQGENHPNPDRGTAPPGTILLGAGEQIVVTPKAAHRTPHPNLFGATAWTQRQLVFDSASLTEVGAEFNRYNERKLVVDPSALGTLHVSGVFASTDLTSFIHFLRDRPGLRVTETPKEIRVEKEP
jgi:ferric-dicitrate binding protein FerR (iron transport regulator)